MTRLELLAALNKFALNSDYYGYDWAELYDFDYIFEELTNEQLLNLYNHYLNYLKGE